MLVVSCRTSGIRGLPAVLDAKAVITTIEPLKEAPYRYYGAARIKAPGRYWGIKAQVFALSFGDDLRKFFGKEITIHDVTADARRNRIGAKVKFNSGEIRIVLQPWGFTPAEILAELSFEADS